MKLRSKLNYHVVIIVSLTLFAFISSAIYYYPSYAYEGVSRDFYLSEGYYLLYVVGRGLLYGALLNGVYFLLYVVVKGILSIGLIFNGKIR